MEALSPTPRRLAPDERTGWLLALIRESFSYMDGLIDPPSSMHGLTEADIARQAVQGEVWVIGREACVFLTPKPPALYIGKLAVAPGARRKGRARALIALAEARAHALSLGALTLQTRIELGENHETFRRLGFIETGATAHPGYAKPTSLTFTRAL